MSGSEQTYWYQLYLLFAFFFLKKKKLILSHATISMESQAWIVQ